MIKWFKKLFKKLFKKEFQYDVKDELCKLKELSQRCKKKKGKN